MANKNPRFGGRSKFTAEGIKAALNAANGTAVQGEIVEGEVTLTKTEETGQTPVARDIAVTAPPAATVYHASVTPASCVKALERAVGFGKSALYLEVGVALACFASSSTGADLATKRVVMGIYQQAGYEVENNGRHYKTVNRRINASAALFNKLGEPAVVAAMHGMRDGKAIESLCSYLGETHKFDSIYAVLEFVGKPVSQTNTPEVRAARSAKEAAEHIAATVGINERIERRRAERSADQQQQKELIEDGIIVSAGKLSLVIPRNCTAAEVMLLVAKLTDFAERLAEEEGTPEEQRNREMHS